jgi:hypothetical protein
MKNIPALTILLLVAFLGGGSRSQKAAADSDLAYRRASIDLDNIQAILAIC